MARRKNYLFTCVNRRPDGVARGSCAARQSEQIHALLKQRLKDLDLAEVDARACTSSCQDLCWVGPTILVTPENYVYGRVKLEDVEEIVQAIQAGERVERLIISEDEFHEPREQKQK
jgi:(2Fe-2S) ferredoxin